MPSILGIIPARGGSKRLPRKNIRILGGKPLIAWTIEAAQKANFLDRVVVSTEDKKIREVAEKWEAEVVSRPKELAQDKTLIQDVIVQVLERIKKKGDYNPLGIMLLNPTSPLRNHEHIDAAAHTFIHSGADTVLSGFVANVNLWSRKENGIFVANYDFKHKGRSQDAPFRIQENGAIYIMRTDWFEKTHELIGGRIVFSKMPEVASVDIDTALDFVIAEAIINASTVDKPKV